MAQRIERARSWRVAAGLLRFPAQKSKRATMAYTLPREVAHVLSQRGFCRAAFEEETGRFRGWRLGKWAEEGAWALCWQCHSAEAQPLRAGLPPDKVQRRAKLEALQRQARLAGEHPGRCPRPDTGASPRAPCLDAERGARAAATPARAAPPWADDALAVGGAARGSAPGSAAEASLSQGQGRLRLAAGEQFPVRTRVPELGSSRRERQRRRGGGGGVAGALRRVSSLARFVRLRHLLRWKRGAARLCHDRGARTILES